MDLSLDIWAFVRIMVALEDAEHNRDSKALYSHWAQEWAEVDQQLAELADTDFDAYADMMMNAQIALELPEDQAKTFQGTLQSLVTQLMAKKKASKDADFRRDLDFEIKGLRALIAG